MARRGGGNRIPGGSSMEPRRPEARPAVPAVLLRHADEEDSPGHWRLSEPHQVWTVEDGSFHPHFGLNPSTPLSGRALSDLLAENPASISTPQAGTVPPTAP